MVHRFSILDNLNFKKSKVVFEVVLVLGLLLGLFLNHLLQVLGRVATKQVKPKVDLRKLHQSLNIVPDPILLITLGNNPYRRY